MSFALACAALLLVALGVTVAPLLRRRPAAGAAAFDRAVYRAQLAELEEDRARGLIGAEEAESARVEIARRLLATEGPAEAAASGSANPALAAVVAAALAAVGGGLYLMRGAPDLEPRAAVAEAGQAGLLARVAALAAQTARAPGDAEAWLAYAEANAGLNRWPDAIAAYRKALALRPDATVHGALGEALTMGADGNVTDEARAEFAASGNDLTARFYLALAEAQAGNAAAAIAGWQKLAAELPAGAPVRAELARRIAAAAQSAGLPVPALAPGQPQAAGSAGPAGAEAAAAMSPQERDAMVRGMVARLAERLAAAPGDAEGWLRLGRAYLVLGEADKAAQAYDRAAALLPGEAVRLQQIAAMFETTPLGSPLPPALPGLVAQEAARVPDQPEVMWYQGLLAARSGRRDEALRHWRALLPKLPEASEERRLVQTAIDAMTKP